MRVIAGEYRGRLLKGPPDSKTRPTSDRLRETLFNVLAPHINDETRFLDLCAGTGAIGIEALSRGASFVTFVDRSKRACALIEENLDKLGVPDQQTTVLNLTAENFTSREHVSGWDIVFFDPPYDSDHSLVMHDFGTRNNLLNAGGILVIEHHSKKHMHEIVGSIRRWRVLKQGETSLSFYENA
ncbi:MAG: 16S rRNA (guanine(966)-N(2))-methyltransferase RsmD [Acidobacteria bacterium]|nr:16S rRNA (guanine(966)-N(2))-methyltransferase RsmD [Acidobacteriota bacterium]